MRKGIFNKFLQHQNLLKVLLSTDDKMLAEHTTRDKYWGDGGDGSGRNQLGKILVETRTLLRYQVITVPPSNYWVINNVLLIGEINVENLNKVGVNLLLDLSGQQTISNKILGQDLPNQVNIYNQRYIFVHSIGIQSSGMPENGYAAVSDLLIQAIGKKYICYVYGSKEQYIKFLTLIFNELPLELARQLTQKLLQV